MKAETLVELYGQVSLIPVDGCLLNFDDKRVALEPSRRFRVMFETNSGRGLDLLRKYRKIIDTGSPAALRVPAIDGVNEELAVASLRLVLERREEPFRADIMNAEVDLTPAQLWIFGLRKD